MIRAGLTRLLQEPPVSGGPALICAFLAIGVPTGVREAVNGVVTGCEFTPYLPFVLLSAILLRWWKAGTVALASIAIMGGLFEGGQVRNAPCFLPAAGIFLASSAVMIGIAVLVRRAINAVQSQATEEPSGGVVLSVEQGDVWASWYGHGRPVRLGSRRKVAEMMARLVDSTGTGKRPGQ
jgi:hypothetical protein